MILLCSFIFLLYDLAVSRASTGQTVALDTKRRFVRFISHEVRTPLNSVRLGMDIHCTLYLCYYVIMLLCALSPLPPIPHIHCIHPYHPIQNTTPYHPPTLLGMDIFTGELATFAKRLGQVPAALLLQVGVICHCHSIT
jgi:signal transduction histidine kinase